MASLKDLRNRIASVKSTQKITKAMQMVAAAKLRRAEEAAAAARPYADRMAAVLANISGAMEGDGPPLMVGTGKDDVHLLVVFTADRGLCGGFNASIVKLARAHQRKLEAEGKTVKFMTVGKKGCDLMRRDLGRQGRRAHRPSRSEDRRLRATPPRSARRSSTCSRRASSTSARSSTRPSRTSSPRSRRASGSSRRSVDGEATGDESRAADDVYEYEPEPGRSWRT